MLLEHLQGPLTPEIPKASPEFGLTSVTPTRTYCAQVPDGESGGQSVTGLQHGDVSGVWWN